ncbi:hypothetical protein SPLC1_S543050 [Arthrospira platensis C1]|nr:hypothetical protein SPLC1_S543050 [Arthrospira platensis C1]
MGVDFMFLAVGKSFNRSVSGLAIVLLMLSVAQLGARAQILPNSNSNIAQTTSDRCRKISEPRGLVVRARPTPNSPVVGQVSYAQQVTLATNAQGITGPGGRSWVEITNPVRGFISNGFPNSSGNLVDCSTDLAETPPTRPSGSLCRQVDREAAPEGVAVRAAPSRSSARRGGVDSGERVQLASDYRLIPDPDGERRNWVKITTPVAGYISANTLIMCR